MKIIKKTLFLVLSVLLLNACKSVEVPKKNHLKGFIFGTSYSIIYLNDENKYQEEIDNLFFLMNKSLSTYIPTSDISKINAGDTLVMVDAYFEEVFYKSKKIHQETDGFFDPTVGSLVNSWGFGPEKGLKNLTNDEVKAKMKWVGFDKIKLVKGKVIKKYIEMYMDFNAIAKGLGIDVVARFLESKNIENYLVEIGGEVRVKGVSDKGKPWKIGLDNPNSDGTRNQSRVLELSNQSMATSGNYRKFRITKDGRKFVHTINPKTGFATESNLLSASVIAKMDCADTDAYATAFMVMGVEKTKKFLEKHQNLDVILLFFNENGEIEEFSTF